MRAHRTESSESSPLSAPRLESESTRKESTEMSERHEYPSIQTTEPEPIARMSRDIRAAAANLSTDEARFLVSRYYAMQRDRIRSTNQLGATLRRAEEDPDKEVEPHAVLSWLASQNQTLEQQIQGALDKYSLTSAVGKWSRGVVGIGPVIAAGLLAYIDITKAPTAGHIWRFAGLDPSTVWNKGEKRPWCADLKTLCWKVGESFVKVSGHEKAFYGKLLVTRKAEEIVRNTAGRNAEWIAGMLTRRSYGDDTDAILWYQGFLTQKDAETYYAAPAEQRIGLAKKLAKGRTAGSGVPMLSPGHVHARAKRWVVKLFLSHWQQVAYRAHFGENAPKPYALSQLGHVHEVQVPDWPF